MLVIVPFAQLHPITDRAVAEFFPDARRVNVAGDNFAYWRLLRSVWDRGEGIVIIEHDIEPTKTAVDQALSCECEWGRSPYPWSITTTASFGFARFSAELLQATSGLLGDEPIHWGLLAWTIEPKLESLGFKPHEHAPVGHHHWQTALPVERCNCGSWTRELCSSQRHHTDDPECACVPVDADVASA